MDGDDFVRQVVSLLNEFAADDRHAMEQLIEARVPCDEALAGHPWLRTAGPEQDGDPPYRVGLLGILNAVCRLQTGRSPSIGVRVVNNPGTPQHGDLIEFFVAIGPGGD